MFCTYAKLKQQENTEHDLTGASSSYITNHKNATHNSFDKETPKTNALQSLTISPNISSLAGSLNNISNTTGNNIQHAKNIQRSPISSIGKKANTTLKAISPVSKPAEMLLSRLHPETTVDEFKSYTVDQFPSATYVHCKKLPTKYSNYSSFQIILTEVPFQDSLNLENWPIDTLVKRFFHSSKDSDISSSRSAVDLPDQLNAECSSKN